MDSSGVATYHNFIRANFFSLKGQYSFGVTYTYYGNAAMSGLSGATASSSYSCTDTTATNAHDGVSGEIPDWMVWNPFYDHTNETATGTRKVTDYDLTYGFSIIATYQASTSTFTRTGGSATAIANANGSMTVPERDAVQPPDDDGGGGENPN